MERESKARYIQMRKALSKKIIDIVLYMAAVTVTSFFFFDFLCFPETYITTWKYQLRNDIKAGDQVAIDYYDEHYIQKGRLLFSDVDVSGM